VSAGSFDVETCGERLTLLPERGIWWAARRTVLVADVHFGKEDIWRRHGIAIPAGSNAADFERLARLITTLRALRCIVLGDFVHGRLESGDACSKDLARFRARTAATEFEVVAGNHDRAATMPAAEGAVRWHHAAAVEMPPFVLAHDPAESPSENAFALAGHVHPVARLGEGKRALRVPVFWQRRRSLVPVRTAPGECLYAVAGERMIPLKNVRDYG
jgi:DNA ligase-associated metallophosphoesterase